MSPTYSIDEVAERFRLSRADVMRRLRARVNQWPHCRPNKRDASTWYFTDRDIDAIDALLRQAGPAVDSWGREKKGKVA